MHALKKKELSIKLLLLEHLNRTALSKDKTALSLRLLERCYRLLNFLYSFGLKQLQPHAILKTDQSSSQLMRKILISYALSWKPCQGDSLNLPDHRIHKDGDGDASFQLKSDSLPHAHAQTTKTFYKHQDSRIMKAQELKTKTSAQTLIYKIFLQRYQVYQGRLLASFQDDAKYEHVGQDTRSQEMDLLLLIRIADPTKVMIGERQHGEDEPKLLDTTVGRTVPLLLVAPARAESKLDASVDRQFDEGDAWNCPLKVIKGLFAKLAEQINIEDRIVNVGGNGSGGGAPAVATPADGVQLPAAPVAKENK
ncbi:hypothetical protein Tco_0977316 [Tanacetum coccineum]|uniref:Uncharacterized protein n=1 Tax=Tanacetum coccineum TaxID=301880 RepID=A0ABQ5EJU4_9ASTR